MGSGLLIGAGCILLFLYLTGSFRAMNRENNMVMAALLGKVKEQYPEIKEEEWIAQLMQSENAEAEYEAGRALLEQYGVYGQAPLSAYREKKQLEIMICVISLLLITGLIIWAAILHYFYKRQKELERLTAYMRRVEQGDYMLEPAENEEDELSSLKNELYKVTVILKENAENSGKQKKALADSVSDISHQLKTPLTSVMVLLDNLSESDHMDEYTRRRFLAEITRQLNNVSWLVAALLKLSRLDAGVVEFERKRISLEVLLNQVLKDLEVMAQWKEISFQTEGSAGFIWGDARWLGEALRNIIKNAIEHSPEGSPIVIQMEENAVYTAVSIKDYGEGISQEEQKHIFERFYRSGYCREDSVGIGLSLAKEIIERQNGYLTVSSKEGEGTEFQIKILKIHESVPSGCK